MRNSAIVTIFLALLLVLLTTTPAFSQSNTSVNTELNKNAIYGTTGFGIISSKVRYTFFSLQYERLISKQTFIKNTSSFLKVGLGTMANSQGSNPDLISKIQYGLLLGKNINKLEIAAGVIYYPNLPGRREKDVHFSGTVAWRHQKPGKSFFYRVGTGLPDYLYFGVGWSF